MFDRIGAKIKVLAKVIFWILTIVSVISGMDLIGFDPLVGMLVMIVGPIVAWGSSLGLYGFGEIIEKLESIEENTQNIYNFNKNKTMNHEQKN